jgi:hypothetical protein
VMRSEELEQLAHVSTSTDRYAPIGTTYVLAEIGW